MVLLWLVGEEGKSTEDDVSDKALGQAAEGVGNILHRVIARIKVCADKFQKEEEEKIFCGGAS